MARKSIGSSSGSKGGAELQQVEIITTAWGLAENSTKFLEVRGDLQRIEPGRGVGGSRSGSSSGSGELQVQQHFLAGVSITALAEVCQRLSKGDMLLVMVMVMAVI